jgi:phosphotransferase system HPr (HPr) family protein
MIIKLVILIITMIKKSFIIKQNEGIHARPAAKIAEKCLQLSSKVTLCNGCNKADGCSILQLLLLDAGKGSQIDVTVNGGNEKAAIDEVGRLFENGAGI